MNINFKLILGIIYLLCLGILLFVVFSYLDLKDLKDYTYIKNNSEILLNYKNQNIALFIIFFFLFCIFWIFLLGFGSPLCLISGFLFGQLVGTLICVLSLTIGSTLLYMFANYYFHDLIVKYLEAKILKYKYLFKKNEFFYFLIFRFTGGAGIPFGIQNILPTIFNMKVSNYFYSTFLGLLPAVFILNSLGQGIEKLIEQNTSLNLVQVILEPGIYIPISCFLLILGISFLIKKKIFKKN